MCYVMIMKKNFIKSELAELTDLNIHRVLDWTKRGYIIPAVKVEGRGRTSRYDLSNAIQAKVLERLSATGITLSRFSSIFHGSTVEKQLRGLTDSLLYEKTESFALREMIFSLVIVNDCETVTIEQTETFEELKLKMRGGDDHPSIDDFWKTVLIVNLNEIFLNIKKQLNAL